LICGLLQRVRDRLPGAFFDSSCAKPFVHPCYSSRKDIHGGKSKDRPYPIERFPLLLFVFLCQVICYYLLFAHDKKYRNPSYINKPVCFPSGRAVDGSKNMDRNHLRIRLEVKNEEKRIDLGFFYIYMYCTSFPLHPYASYLRIKYHTGKCRK
jgi:hypothetical protein